MKYFTILFFLGITIINYGQDWQKFSCDGTGRGMGLEFALKYPPNWSSQEGMRPHMIEVMDYEDPLGTLQMGIYVRKLDFVLNPDDLGEVIDKKAISSIFPGSEIISYNDKAKVDGEKCITATIKTELQIYDKSVNAIAKINMILWH